ncbi:MAG: NAD(P)-dependent oxidoreductase [Deltaproteobacteria bacterium]|nr:NAD(P)-dependent oxidoreductase [Deltaproteobacteria bacterium]
MTSTADAGTTSATKCHRILLTGAGGCLGGYLLEEFMNESPEHLVLLLRDPDKIRIGSTWRERLTIIRGDLNELDPVLPQIENIDQAVLAAACWGGSETFPVNVMANLRLTIHLAARGCCRIIYLSTASVLDREGNLLPAARDLGSEYIRSKYRLVEVMENLEFLQKTEIIGLFPTLILGGGPGKPYSHFARLLQRTLPWAWLWPFLRAEGAFHFIHGLDIARIVRHLTESPLAPAESPRRIVLGNPVLSVNEFIGEFSAYLGKKAFFQVNLKSCLIEALIKIFRIRLSPWDRYCLEKRDLSFQNAVNPSAFGLPVYCPNPAAGLAAIDIKAEQ